MKRQLSAPGLMPVLAISLALLAGPVAAQGTGADAMRQTQEWAPAASVPALQVRMKAIREATDPERRMALMEEQIKALETASQAVTQPCPMGIPMQGGRSPGTGPGAAGGMMMMDPALMQEHMKMMQQHLDMMQRMMKAPAPASPPATK
ncbi:MAG: hypothetical protein JSS47_06875 [Proteobacteria bacterium]|nr:hypothetical protein [Pseudomonadota bacterium]